MTFRRTALVACVALLAGCATSSSPEQASLPVAVPATWSQGRGLPSGSDPTALATWWTPFKDPVLDQLIVGALRSSPTIRTAQSRIAEYRTRRGFEQSGLWPSLGATVSGGSTRTDPRGSSATTTTESYGASLDASWQLDFFGRQRLALTAAAADLAQTEEDFSAAQVALAAEIAQAYVALRSAEAQVSVVENSLGTRRETVQLTRWRELAGTGDALDTQQAVSALAQARASLPLLQITVVQSRHQLALLSGLLPGGLDALLAAPAPVPVVGAQLAVGIPAETLRQRPDVRAAERAVDAAQARTQAAQRERLPSLALTGSIGVEALRADRLFSPDTTVARVLGSLTAPIFNAGRIRQTIAIRSEQTQQSLIAYESTVLTALVEVEYALVAARRTAERLDLLALATGATREAATLAALQYQAGRVDLLVSLEAQRTLLSLEQQQITTAADLAGATIQLYRALGGGWSRP